MTGRFESPSAAVAWTVLAAPWGPIHVATSASAVVAVEHRTTDEAFLARLGVRRFATDPDNGARAFLDRVRWRIQRYLEGDFAALDKPDLPLAFAGLSGWDVDVLRGVRLVPAGQVTSYGRVAAAIGRRGAARAVGGAVGRNPIALLIPCHRVIAGDGTLGGYGGSWYLSREDSLDLKRALLAHEGIRLPHRFVD